MPTAEMTDFLDEAMIWIGDQPVGKMKNVTVTYDSDFEDDAAFEPIKFLNDMSCEFTCTYSYVNNKLINKLLWNWKAKGPIRKKQILKMRRKYYGY